MLKRSQARRRTHGEMARAELGEGFDHLRQAATHAADGVGAAVGPKLSSAMDLVGPGTDRVRDVASQGWDTTVAALTPLMDAARTGATEAGRKTAARARKKMTKKKTSRMSGKRTGIMVGLLAVGVAAGAVGAMAARRRSRSRWEEYESGGYSMAGDQAQAVLDSTRSAMDMAAGKTSGGDTATAPSDQLGNGKDPAPPRPGQGPEGTADKAGTATKNSRG
ncbi:hypothetical protein [Rugosimonospora africana]|uniref:Uncharacterized protein n=1 Tax=Rugosimonospora africana TaxID=556532 RepID=A0A8J3QM62_9ACTN|nr:hypothetical protein [Rugosimonospora africana]GIH13141.1 hypothetical protein Raf01_13130 [Rugosimonospora africana]